MNRRGELLFNFSLSAGKIAEEGLMVDILLRLPVKSLIRFKSVCKSWRSLISDPCFERAHLSRSTLVNPNSQRLLLAFEHPGSVLKLLYCEITNSEAAIEDENDLLDCSVKFKLPKPARKGMIAGSCHGLVCLDIWGNTYTDRTLVVWNPTTGAFKEIPLHPTQTDNHTFFVLGFGYDSAIDDYKIVAYAFLELVIFTMKENCWRTVCASMLQGKNPPVDVGAYANGCLHWLQFFYVDSVEPRASILSFDLSNEKFERIPTPTDIDYKCSFEMVEFRGCLLFYTGKNGYRCHKCWITEERGSWTKVRDVTCQYGDSETTGRVMCCRTDAKALLRFYRGEKYMPEDFFCLYSPKKNIFTPFAPFRNPMLRFAQLYVESLVSP